MADVAALTGFAQAITFDGFGQNHGWLTFVQSRRLVRRIHLLRIMPAALEFLDLGIGQVVDHGGQGRIRPEEMATGIAARLHAIFLVVTINSRLHPSLEQAVMILGQQRIPVRSPDHLDHVPAGAAEGGFQFLDDLAVPANRSVKSLEVAVDDPGQVIKLLAGCQRQGTQCFGFIDFAIAHVTPNSGFLLGGINQTPSCEIAEKACLVNGHDRSETHGDSRELPEIGHQVRMRI